MVVSDEETTEKKNHDEETGDADSPRKAVVLELASARLLGVAWNVEFGHMSALEIYGVRSLIDQRRSDDEAMALDETCIIALEYRFPIHRLAMLLSDSQNNKLRVGKELKNGSRFDALFNGVCGSQKVEEHSVPGKNLHEALKRMKSNMLMCQESMAEKMVVSDEETTEKKNHDEETGDADHQGKRC
ncbi:hypothetical protein Tco_0304510 [Tanacetum coccineum]